MEWQTPAVSEKFQSRFGRRPGTADSGDTGLGTSASDSTEGDDFCMEHCLREHCLLEHCLNLFSMFTAEFQFTLCRKAARCSIR